MLLVDVCKDEVSTQSVKSVNVRICLVFLECIIMNYKCISTAKPSLILYLRHQLLLLIYLMVILFEVVWIYCKSSYKIKKIKNHIFVLLSFCRCLKQSYGSSLRSIFLSWCYFNLLSKQWLFPLMRLVLLSSLIIVNTVNSERKFMFM